MQPRAVMRISTFLRGAFALVLILALVLVTRDEGPRESAEQLIATAENLQNKGEYQPALELFKRALKLAVESGDRQKQAEALFWIGKSYQGLGKPEHAIEPYLETRALLRQIGSRQEDAAVLQAVGEAYEDLGQWQKALDSYEAARTIWQELNLFPDQAKSLRSLGNVLLELGEVTAACDAYEEAFELSKLWEEPKGNGRSWNGVGRCRLARGEMAEAIAAFETAIKLGQQTKLIDLQAGARNNLAEAYRRQGNLSAALAHQLAVNELWEQHSGKVAIANGFQNLGNLYVALGKQQEALERYQNALALYREVGQPSRAALSRLSVSWVRLAQGQVDAAVTDLEHLHIEQQAKSDPKLANDVARALGIAYLAAKRADAAKKLFEWALDRGLERDDLIAVARSLTGLGEAQAALGESEHAAASFKKALERGGKLSNPAIEALSLRGLAQLARDHGDLEEALRLAEQALEIIENRRAQVPPELRATFLAEQQSYYELRLDLLLRLHQRHRKRGFDTLAFEASERARARELLDLLTERGEDEDADTPREPVFAERERALNGELVETLAKLETAAPKHQAELQRKRSNIKDAIQQLKLEISNDPSFYNELRYGTPASFAQVQQLLEPGNALIEYALGEESSLGFVVTRKGLHSFPIAATAAELAARVADVRRDLAKPGRLSTYLPAASLLYERLLRPAETHLAGIKHVVVVPDRGLYALPFEALLTAPPTAGPPVPAKLPYLLARWSVSYAPSASVLRLLLARAKSKPPTPAALELVAFADPPYSGGLKPLPASADEARSIAALYPVEQTRLFLGAKASEENVKGADQVRTARRLHFATHGLLEEGSPQLSALALGREPSSVEDGRLRVYEIFRLKLAAELVVLSACETGLGQEVPREGLIGLARAFLYAGASRVAVSLWRVEDKAMAELMRRFYHHLDGHSTTAEALSKAKLELMREGGFAHPAYWASFTLIGLP